MPDGILFLVTLEYLASLMLRSLSVMEAFLEMEISPSDILYLRANLARDRFIDSVWPGRLHSLLAKCFFQDSAHVLHEDPGLARAHTHACAQNPSFFSSGKALQENLGLSLESYQQMSLLCLKARIFSYMLV